jgi:hypothetical protein
MFLHILCEDDIEFLLVLSQHLIWHSFLQQGLTSAGVHRAKIDNAMDPRKRAPPSVVQARRPNFNFDFDAFFS